MLLDLRDQGNPKEAGSMVDVSSEGKSYAGNIAAAKEAVGG